MYLTNHSFIDLIHQLTNEHHSIYIELEILKQKILFTSDIEEIPSNQYSQLSDLLNKNDDYSLAISSGEEEYTSEELLDKLKNQKKLIKTKKQAS